MISEKIELTLWKLEPPHLHEIWGMPLHDKASNLFGSNEECILPAFHSFSFLVEVSSGNLFFVDRPGNHYSSDIILNSKFTWNKKKYLTNVA